MDIIDDDLRRFVEHGPTPLPPGGEVLEADGASIWHASYGEGEPVVLLHGGLGNSRNWGYQVEALVAAGRRVIVMDTRGHGRSSRDDRPLDYEWFAGDLAAVLAAQGVQRAPLVGWSDGAVTALALARRDPAAVASVLFFACNVDAGGAKEFVYTTLVGRCLDRHRRDHRELSPSPDDFDALSEDLGVMQAALPDYTEDDLAAVVVPVTVVHAEHDEFIHGDHLRYIAEVIPGGRFVELEGHSHFVPIARPQVFTRTILDFLETSGE